MFFGEGSCDCLNSCAVNVHIINAPNNIGGFFDDLDFRFLIVDGAIAKRDGTEPRSVFLLVFNNFLDFCARILDYTLVAPCTDAKYEIVALFFRIVVAHGVDTHAYAFTLFDE